MEKIVVEIDKDLEPIFGSFLTNRQKDIELLKDAIANSSFDSIESIGHKLAGNAGSYGLPDLGEIGARLEQSAIDNDLSAIETDFQKYTDYLNNLEIKFV
ncbi:MAG: Hpt domain-containing protein [Oligoflexia bacterium]|nr:Hpt domain-containing protein [Oligoflexia bacterium]